MYLSVLACDLPVSRLCPEGGKCLGVDISAGLPAPSGKLSGTHFGLDGPDALVFEAFEILLSGGFPFGEGRVPPAFRQERFE
ncbi:hypothetical protein FKV25_01960 [Lysobacter aestuarii]|uniref:Uncharacterized protein n=1 Tax=Marilutibacter aestuarii TaxID=1706195 RepID=A0A508ARX3_9GAMM|nr:hypothetical protein FKV25_01960 [Lysobacter aestuarii]